MNINAVCVTGILMAVPDSCLVEIEIKVGKSKELRHICRLAQGVICSRRLQIQGNVTFQDACDFSAEIG